MGQYLDAADNYVKERSFKFVLFLSCLAISVSHCFFSMHSTASQCLAWASLLGMQLQLGPEVRLVGLTQAEARKTMGVRPFTEGITIARAYDLHRLKYSSHPFNPLPLLIVYALNRRSEWLPAVYQHAIVSGHPVYVDELWQHLPYDSSLYSDLIQRYKSDPQRVALAPNCKKFLISIGDKFISCVPPACRPSVGHSIDSFLRYDLARDLGFDDVVHQLGIQHPEIVEWKTPSPTSSSSTSSLSSSSSFTG